MTGVFCLNLKWWDQPKYILSKIVSAKKQHLIYLKYSHIKIHMIFNTWCFFKKKKKNMRSFPNIITDFIRQDKRGKLIWEVGLKISLPKKTYQDELALKLGYELASWSVLALVLMLAP